jgi:MFS family permease
VASIQSRTRAWALLLFVVCLPRVAAAQGEATLQIDLAADEQYRRCLAHVSADRTLQARACFQAIIEASPESTAALRAQSALNTLKARRAQEESTLLPPGAWPFKPGRLELSLMSGAFGIFTGGALAASFAAQPFATQGPILPMVSGAGGAMSVALGGGFAVGSFFIGELLDLKPGKSRLIGSGMAWGVGLGVAMAPWIFMLTGTQWAEGSIVPDFASVNYQLSVPAASLTSLLFGYAGLGVGAGAAFVLDLTPGQVSLVNTGAWSGLALGALASPLLGLAGFGHAGWLGLAWITGATLGLGWGSAMAFLLDFDVWEVLCIDAAGLAALAGVGLAAGGIGFVAGNQLWLNAILGGITGAAVIGAMAVATAGMAFWRIKRGGKVSRLGFLPVEDLFATPEAEVVFDKAGRPTPIAGLIKLNF